MTARNSPVETYNTLQYAKLEPYIFLQGPYVLPTMFTYTAKHRSFSAE